MSLVGQVGDARSEMTFEWKLPDFSTLSDKVDDFYVSPAFSFAESRWHLRLCTNGETKHSSSGCTGLYLEREDPGLPRTVHFKLGIRCSDRVEKHRELKFEFSAKDKNFGFPKCWSRSDLMDRKEAYLPNDVLTVTCDLRSDGALSVVKDNGLLEKNVESLMEQINNLQKTVENYEMESENYKKKISTLETEKSSTAERYKCLLEEKLNAFSGLEKENKELKKQLESCKEEIIKTLHKKMENYELELENYKEQISASEREKLSIVEQYKCLLGEKFPILSGLEKDNGLVEKKMVSRKWLMEQIKTLQKTVENYQLESAYYKKQINAAGSEKSSIEEQYKCLLEEKSTTVSKLEKDNEQLKKEVESFIEQIKTLQKTVENYEVELENYKKIISSSEREKPFSADQYEDHLKEITVSGLENDKEQLKREVESCKEERKTFQKSVENYDMESENYKKQTSASEMEKSSILEQYRKCLLGEKFPILSGLEKDKEMIIKQLKRDVESCKEEINSTQKSVENYMKQLIASEGEEASIVKQNKCLLEEKVTNIVRLETDNEQLKREVESCKEEINSTQKSVENDMKQLRASEDEEASVVKQNKYLLEEKVTNIVRRETDNEQLKREVESCKEEINSTQKSVENDMKQLRASEDEEASVVKQNKCLLEEKVTNIVRLETDNQQLEKEVEYFIEEIKTLQKTVENYELESKNYKEQISALETEKSSIAEQHKCLLEEKLMTLSGLEKDNEQLKKEIKTLQKSVKNYESEKASFVKQNQCLLEERVAMFVRHETDKKHLKKHFKEQIKTLQKTVENYELESKTHNEQISALERGKSSIAEQYKCLLEEKLKTILELEKDNEQLKKEVKSLVEQIQAQQKTVESYELESESYKKQISALEREKSSISGLEKESDWLKKRVESLMEEIDTLQKTVENHELESENYKKKISVLESSGLRKVIFFGILFFIVLEILSFLSFLQK